MIKFTHANIIYMYASVERRNVLKKSKNIFNLPIHFSLVLGDLIANRNIEYGSADDDDVVVEPTCGTTFSFFSPFLLVWNPNKGLITQRVRWDALH